MTAKTHEAAGLISAEAICLTIGTRPAFTALTCLGALAGAILPDFDTPNSKIGHKLPFLFLPIWLFHGLVSLLAKFPGPFKKMLERYAKTLGHRGFSHYPITWFIIGLILLPLTISLQSDIKAIVSPVLCGLGIGIASHILGDTVFGGVSLLYPFCDKRIRISPFKTGGIAESAVCIALLAGCIYMTLNVFGQLIA